MSPVADYPELKTVTLKVRDYCTDGHIIYLIQLRNLADDILRALFIDGADFVEVDWAGIGILIGSQYAVFVQSIRHDVSDADRVRITYENVRPSVAHIMMNVVSTLYPNETK